MAQPDVIRGSYIDIAIGDGASPEVFTIVCGLTTKSFTAQVNTSDTFVPDCADPEDVPIRRLIATGEQFSLSGEGLYNRSQRTTIEAARGVTSNYRFIISEPTGDAIEDGYYEGPAMLVNVQFGGGSAADGNFATASFQFESDGAWVWEDAA